MALEPIAREHILSRKFSYTRDGLSITTEWFIFHTDNPQTAASLLPKVKEQYKVDGVLLPSFVDSVDINPTENQSPITQSATVQYKPFDAGSGSSRRVTPQHNVATWTRTIETETINVQKAKEQENFPKLKTEYLTIGELADKNVEGVDILSPVSVLKIVHWLNQKTASPEFLDAIEEGVTNKVNKKEFAGPWGKWKAGEVLYMGADISTAEGNLIQLSHTFRRSREVEVDVPYLNEGTGTIKTEKATKRGWDYLWSLFKPIPNPTDPTKGSIPNAPVSSHIARVYDPADFKILNLPPQFVGGSE